MHKYDEKFKKMIISLNESGSTIKQLTEEYGVSRATINNWKRLYKPLDTNGNKTDGVTFAEYKKIQKEMVKLQEENEVLKKCVTIFSKK